MKQLNNLSTVVGGMDDYIVTPETYSMFVDLAKLYLEESTFFEMSDQTQDDWPYAPVYFEARSDKNFGLRDVDFTLNIGIKLTKVEDMA